MTVRAGGSWVRVSLRIWASAASMLEREEKLLVECGVWDVEVWPFGGEMRVVLFWKADGGWNWESGKDCGGCGGGSCGLVVVRFGMRVCTFGGKMGSSGCRSEAMRSRSTTLVCERVEKYARF